MREGREAEGAASEFVAETVGAGYREAEPCDDGEDDPEQPAHAATLTHVPLPLQHLSQSLQHLGGGAHPQLRPRLVVALGEHTG